MTPHLHLVLNHAPALGLAAALCLMALSWSRRSEALRRAGLELCCVAALVTLPVYLSGVGADVRLSGGPEVSRALAARHHDAALPALVAMMLTGGCAWLALWRSKQAGRLSHGPITALAAAGTLVLLARTATRGGAIRHPEIAAAGLGADADPAVAAWLSAGALADAVTMNAWVWPAAETLHFVGLWVLFGVVLAANGRLLGVLTAVPFGALHRLLPWAALAFGLNVATGMLFVIGAPAQYVGNASFAWKIAALMVAGAQLLYLTSFDGPWATAAHRPAPPGARVAAAAGIAAWVGVMYFGRMLPFLEL